VPAYSARWSDAAGAHYTSALHASFLLTLSILATCRWPRAKVPIGALAPTVLICTSSAVLHGCDLGTHHVALAFVQVPAVQVLTT
jgi:hypothetical protein